MPTDDRRSLKKWVPPFAIAGGLAALMLLSNRPVSGPSGLPLINNQETYNQVLAEAMAIVKPRFEQFDAGIDLSDEDRKELRRAASLFDAMNTFQPTKTGPYIGSGKSYAIVGEYQMADERLRQCISNAQYDQSDAGKLTVIEAKYLLALVRFEQKDFQASYDLADDAVRSIPNSANYLFARANASLQLGKFAEAKQDIETALSIDPEHKRAQQLQKLIQSDERGS